MKKISETIIAKFKEGDFRDIKDVSACKKYILENEENHEAYVESILLGNLKNFNLESMQLASTILDKKLKLCFDELNSLDKKRKDDHEKIKNELDNIKTELSITKKNVDELKAERSKCEKELEELIQQFNSYISKYIAIMSHCGTITTHIITKVYFDFLITLSGSPEDLDLHVEQTLNLYGVCYRDNKNFLNEITLFYDGLLTLIQKINNNLELKKTIEEEIVNLLEIQFKKTEECNNLSEKLNIDNSEQNNNINIEILSCISFYETLIRICSKNVEESKGLLDRIVVSSNGFVRAICCTNLEFGTYDFSADEFNDVVEIYSFLNQVNLWMNNNNTKEEDKMMVMNLAKLIKVKINHEYSGLEINYKLGQEYKNFCVNVFDMEQNDFELLFSLAEWSKFDNVGSSNRLLPIAQAYLLYDLILSNKIVFNGEEPPFVSEIRSKGFCRKLVNPNTEV